MRLARNDESRREGGNLRKQVAVDQPERHRVAGAIRESADGNATRIDGDS